MNSLAVRPLLVLLTAWWLLASIAAAASPQLEFTLGGEVVGSLSLDQMQQRLRSESLELLDPMYGKTKRYEAFRLAEVMDAAYTASWREHTDADVALVASDGYEAVASLNKLQESGGYLVFRDLDYPQWEPVGRHQANPGPFYVVWTGPEQTTEHAYPWPWQLAAVRIIRFADRYPAVVPQGADQNSPAYRGFITFKQRCVRCHAMDQQGGAIGPDLNAPRSIVEYRSAMMIKAFIRQPSAFRHSYMPDHTDLSEQQLDQLIAYFQWQWRAKSNVD